MNSIFTKPTIFSVFLLLFLSINLNSFAQDSVLDFNNYQPLEAKGEIPQDFLKRTSDYYKAKSENNILTNDKKLEENKDKFNVVSSFHLNQLLWSGSVLFGDTITTYVQEVGKKVLQNYPNLQGKVQFYVTKEHSVNAFTTPEGFIFVNLGLLAHLDNEAQLAFILSHEITHFVKKHSINQFLYNREIEKSGKGGIARWLSKSKSLYEEQAKKSSYSKEQEIEADDYGWEIFSKTGYDLSEAVAAFSSLKNSRYPFDTLTFDSKFLNNSIVNLPDSFYYRDTTHFVELPKLTKEEIEKIESLRTHPDIEERKKLALEKLIALSDKKGSKYLVSEQRFKLVQKIARFELCNLYLQEEQFVDAIYNALILESQYGKSKYSDFCIVRALYGLAAYDIYGKRIYLEHPYNEINWKGRNWFYALEELHHDQIAVLAAAHLIEFADTYKGYEYLYYFIPKLFFTESLKIVNETTLEGNSIFSYRADKDSERDYNVSLRELTDMGVMEEAWLKIKTNPKIKELGLLDEDRGLKRGLAKLFELSYLNEDTVSEQAEAEADFEKYITKDSKKIVGTPELLLDEKILIIRPIFVDIRKKKKKQNLVEFLEKGQIALINSIVSYNTNRLDENRLSLIIPDLFRVTDVDKYNDLASIHLDLGLYYSRDAVQQMKLIDIPNLEKLSEKYDTKYLARLVVIQDELEFGVFMQVQNLKNGLIKFELLKTNQAYYMKDDTWQRTLKQLLNY